MKVELKRTRQKRDGRPTYRATLEGVYVALIFWDDKSDTSAGALGKKKRKFRRKPQWVALWEGPFRGATWKASPTLKGLKEKLDGSLRFLQSEKNKSYWRGIKAEHGT